MIKYIILDFGNVLAYPITGNWYITPKFLELIDMDKIDSEKLDLSIKKFKPLLDRKIITLEEEYNMFFEFYNNLLKENNYPNYNIEIVKEIAYNRTYENDKYKLYENVKEELSKLSKKYTVILLSDNWPCAIDVMKEFEIFDYFKAIYISSIYGQLKEDGDFFDKPIRDFNILDGEAIFIDDNEKLLDVATSKKLKVRLMDREGKVKESKYKIINDLNDL